MTEVSIRRMPGMQKKHHGILKETMRIGLLKSIFPNGQE